MKIPFFGVARVMPGYGFVFFAALLIIGGWHNAQGQESSATPDASSKENSERSAPAGKMTPQDQSRIKVVFDENLPGVIFIESNGEKIRVDTAKKTVEQIVAKADKGVQPETPQDKSNAAADDNQKEESAYDFDRGEEPYDHRLVNIPTPKSSWKAVATSSPA